LPGNKCLSQGGVRVTLKKRNVVAVR